MNTNYIHWNSPFYVQTTSNQFIKDGGQEKVGCVFVLFLFSKEYKCDDVLIIVPGGRSTTCLTIWNTIIFLFRDGFIMFVLSEKLLIILICSIKIVFRQLTSGDAVEWCWL